MKKPLLVLSCIVIVLLTQAVGAQEITKWPDKQIEELSKKYFYYSNIDGKRSLALRAQPEDDSVDSTSRAAQTDPCENDVVKLGGPGEAVGIPGTSLILAFLECPSIGFEYGSIVAFFDRNNLNAPLCFSRQDLMTEGGIGRAYYYGTIGSLNVRQGEDNALYVVAALSGGDAGDSWTSFAIMHIDMNCKITMLAKLYSSYHCNGGCEGSKMKHRFLNKSTVEVTKTNLTSTDRGPEQVTKTTREKYHLTKLYHNPGLRIFHSKSEKAAALLNSGADINMRDKNGNTPLMWAAVGGSPDLVKALISKGAQVNAMDKNGNTPLIRAVKMGHRHVVEALLENGAEVETKGKHNYTPLLWAVRRGPAEIVELLLDKGAKVDAKDKDGDTPLFSAIKTGQTGAVNALLNSGVEIESKNKHNLTPLMSAAETGRVAMVRLLLEKGAQVNATMANGSTSLMYAAQNGHDTIAKLLLQRGAHVNAAMENGWTPLMYAAKEDYAEIVKVLLDKGADVSARTRESETALMIAYKYGRTEISELLKAHGAKE